MLSNLDDGSVESVINPMFEAIRGYLDEIETLKYAPPTFILFHKLNERKIVFHIGFFANKEWFLLIFLL